MGGEGRKMEDLIREIKKEFGRMMMEVKVLECKKRCGERRWKRCEGSLESRRGYGERRREN